jgi:NAD(P)-dependent dehydrogenase (short-subunit alcohol dehydrogenase family)
MADRLKGKVALITGGASGIGAATARLFIREGASVVIADRQAPMDQALASLVGDDVSPILFQQTDVTKETEVVAAIALAVSTYGKLDVTVACAGVDGQGADTDVSEADWDKVMAVNAKGVFFVTKHAIPEMQKTGGGSIVNISSTFGIAGAPGFAAYCASKGAVRTFTKGTAVSYAAERIRANSVHPGVTETLMLKSLFDRTEDPDATRALFSAQHPLPFNADPEDIGWGCVYLASDEARFVTGIELVIDGGLLAR